MSPQPNPQRVAPRIVRVPRAIRNLCTLTVVVGAGACSGPDAAQIDLVDGRMAVMPLQNETGDASLDAVAAGFEAAVAAAAAAIDGAEVILVSQTADVSGDDSPSTIAARTGASLVVSGAMTDSGMGPELAVEIIDPVDGTTMHGLPAEGDDMASAVSRMASRVAGALAIHVDPEWTSPQLYSPPTIEAYRITKHADSMFSRNEQNDAIPFYYEAHDADTMFMQPMFMAAAAHRNNGRAAIGDSLLDYIEAHRDRLTEIEEYNLTWYRGSPTEAYFAAVEARKLDTLGWTYGVGLRANQAGFFAEAAEALSHRAELAAMGNYSAQTWPAWRGQYLQALHGVGDYETELAEAQLARADFQDNVWWIWDETRARIDLGQIEYAMVLLDSISILLETNENPSHFENLEDIAMELKAHGHPDEAAPLMEQVIDHYREVDNPAQLADALGYAGRTDEAYHTLLPIVTEESGVGVTAWLGAAAAIIGETDMAEQILARLESRPEATTGNNLRYQAAIRGALGQCERAVELFRQANDAGLSYIQAWGGEWWHRDWKTEPVRNNCPQFQTLLNRHPG